MEELFRKSEKLVARSINKPVRSLYDTIRWDSKLIGIKGARGTGKTTLLLQRLYSLGIPVNEALFVSLDDFYFSRRTLVETAETFIQKGGKVLFLDEVHKYPHWAQQIKNLYDFTDLQIVFTGSSIIDIAKEEGDLSRRAIMYQLNGLSFREYLAIAHQMPFPVLPIEETIVNGSLHWKKEFPDDFRPYAYFSDYLQYGYYPIFIEGREMYSTKIQQVTRQIVEYDMAELKDFDVRNAKKMLQLLAIIAENVPFKPNIVSLAERTGMNRATLYNYLHFLEEAKLIQLLYPSGISMTKLQKPEKIYLENTSLAYALTGLSQPDIGNLRETFVFNQLKVKHAVTMPMEGDFLLDNQWILEVGGKNKTRKQIANIPNSYRVLDDFEFTSIKDIIPMWMVGFLY